MKRTTLIIILVCTYSGLSSTICAQAPKKQQQSQRKTSQRQKTSPEVNQPQAPPTEASKPKAPSGEASKSQLPQATNNTQKMAEEFINKYFGGRDQWGQRFGYKSTEDKPSPESLLINPAVEVMNREGVNVAEFFASLSKFCADTNVFWKDSEPQKEIVSNYAKRIPLVPASVYREWTEALGNASGYGKLQMMYNLGTIILLDGIFDSKGFREEEAKRFILRLRSTPYEATKKWADTHSIQTYQAAISLINIESLFSKDVFQQEAFAKLVKK